MVKTVIIDDDKLICFLHQKLVIKSEIDQNPLVFSKAVLALDYFKKNIHLEKHFLILLDINMKRMDAWEFMEQLKIIDKNRKCDIILITSSINRKDKEKAADTQYVTHFMEKPLLANHCDEIKNIEAIKTYFN